MKNPLFKTVVSLAIMLFIGVATCLNAQTIKVTNKHLQKPLYIVDGKIKPLSYDSTSIDPKIIVSMNVLKPGSPNLESLIEMCGDSAQYGIALVYTNKTTINDSLITKQLRERIYPIPEKMPEYPGGELALLNFVASNVRYPVRAQETGVQGKVIVRFVINSRGKVEKPEVYKSLSYECNKEAIRIAKLISDYSPAELNGKKVAVWCYLPITFKLE